MLSSPKPVPVQVPASEVKETGSEASRLHSRFTTVHAGVALSLVDGPVVMCPRRLQGKEAGELLAQLAAAI